MRAIAIAIVVAAIAAAALLLLTPEDPADVPPDEAELSAAFSVSVDFDDADAVLSMTPRAGDFSHTWTVDTGGSAETLISEGGGAVRISVPISADPVRISHTASDGDREMSSDSTVDVSGKRTVTLTWSGGSVDVDVDYATYHSFRDRGAIHYSIGAVARWEDPAAVAIASYLSGVCDGMDNDGKARTLLRFVQEAIAYETDFQSTGHEEWFKSVYETVFDGEGDCEDTAIMFTSIGRLMGLDVLMINFVGHIGAAVVMDDCSGQSWTYEGKTYYYCETAVDGSTPAIGEDPIGAQFIAIVL